MKLIALEDGLVDTFCSPIWPSFALCHVHPHELMANAATYTLFALATDSSRGKLNIGLGIYAGFGDIRIKMTMQNDSNLFEY